MSRKQRRSMTRNEKRETGMARELRVAKEFLRRNGHAPTMTTVKSRNAA